MVCGGRYKVMHDNDRESIFARLVTANLALTPFKSGLLTPPLPGTLLPSEATIIMNSVLLMPHARS
jgi:hypothetical protein